MSKLSKFLKTKVGKGVLTGVRVIAAGVTKGKSEKVISNLKGIGAAVKTYKGLTKRPSKSEAAVQAKAAAVSPPKIVGISSVVAQSMPGGKKLPNVGGSVKRARVAVVKKTRRKAAAKQKQRALKAPGLKIAGKRQAPSGGKDFKALSASWKKAGKPGKWIDWVKSH